MQLSVEDAAAQSWCRVIMQARHHLVTAGECEKEKDASEGRGRGREERGMPEGEAAMMPDMARVVIKAAHTA